MPIGGVKNGGRLKTDIKYMTMGSLGEVQIADEVVAIIAGLAATEVEGVGSMAGNITNELVENWV